MGGKLFGNKSERVSTEEMYRVYDSVKNILGERYVRMEISEPLSCKTDHGDIDIIVIPNFAYKDRMYAHCDHILEYSRNGNIHSILFHSEAINKNVHIDFIHTNKNNFETQKDYIRFGDFSGVIGVLSRRINYQYGTKGFSKIYIDKRGQYHYIPLMNNLMDGLKVMGYEDVIHTYKDIKSLDDIVTFISSSELFDSEYFVVDNLVNRSDRKRLRMDRPSATYIREKLELKNKRRPIDDDDYFLKKLFPKTYAYVLRKIDEIENSVPYKSIYDGNWILENFKISPGPIIKDIKLHWSKLYGENIDNVDEKVLKEVTNIYLQNIYNVSS